MKIQLLGGVYYPVTNWARYVPHKRSCGTLARAHREHLAGRGVILNDKESWTRISGVYNSRDGGECFITIGNFIVDTESNLTFVDSGATPAHNKSYYYIDDVSVIALDSVPDGVEEVGAADLGGVHAYPNPTSGLLSIDNGTDEDMSVSIIDALGRAVKLGLVSTGDIVEVDISVFPSGIYLVIFRGNDTCLVERIIKE